MPSRYVLTDGQQRITTTMLFLIALRDTIEDKNYKETIQKRFLVNERTESGTEYKIKLKQVETDWEAYRLLVLGHGIPTDLKNSSVYQNYLFFKRELSKFSDAEVKSLLENGLTKFSIISIQLEPDRNPWENPQEIFESMNSLGKPLSLADLVRNYLLMGKSADEQTKLYDQYWLSLEKRLQGNLSPFIRDWMQADQHKSYKVARENNYKELYNSFKEIVNNRNVEELFKNFLQFAHPYSIACGLERTGLPVIDQVLVDLNIIGVAPAYSYLTEVLMTWLNKELDEYEVASILIAIRTYLLRRRVLGITQAENKFFPTLGSRIDEIIKSSDVEEAVFTQLSSYEYALRLPNDDEMESRLRSMNFYNLGKSRNYPRLLLSIIEELLTKSRPLWDDNHLQLEHIMPQKLNSDWRDDLGENAIQDHQEYLNNIGNITLIRHNQELGNKAFSEKKKVYAGQSGLQITQNYILDCEKWGVNSIKRRQNYLIEQLFGHVIIVPNRFRRSNNWNQSGEGSSQFDSRQILNQLIGETIHFVSNPALTAQVLSDSKVLFEDKEWSLSPLTRELKQREGDSNKSGAYQGALHWSWDDTRLVDLD
ncbi:MAG: DUF262 domain-containing protein [Microbacteriaceae bacterium]|nr:DUF262 domain-containing protein [Microbacteriaceae bacterium]